MTTFVLPLLRMPAIRASSWPLTNRTSLWTVWPPRSSTMFGCADDDRLAETAGDVVGEHDALGHDHAAVALDRRAGRLGRRRRHRRVVVRVAEDELRQRARLRRRLLERLAADEALLGAVLEVVLVRVADLPAVLGRPPVEHLLHVREHVPLHVALGLRRHARDRRAGRSGLVHPGERALLERARERRGQDRASLVRPLGAVVEETQRRGLQRAVRRVGGQRGSGRASARSRRRSAPAAPRPGRRWRPTRR